MITIKANLHQYLRSLGVVRPLVAILLTFLLWWKFGLVVWMCSVVFLVLLIGLGIYLLQRRTISLTADAVEYRTMFNQRVAVPYKNIESVKLFPNYVDPAFGTAVRLSIATKSAAYTPISLQSFYWDAEDLRTVAKELAKKEVTLEQHDDFVTYSDISTLYPKYATFIERNPGKIALIVTPILIIGIVVVAFLISFS